jgi:hypothetical protein
MKPHRFWMAMLALTLATWSLLAGSAGRCTAQEKYTIKPNYQEGLQWNCTMTRTQNSSQSVHSGGQLLGQTTLQVESAYAASMRVAAAKDGLPTDMRVEFAKECSDTLTMQGQAPQKGPSPMAGQTVTFHKGEDGNLSSDFKGELPPQMLQYLNSFIYPESTLYTLKPVAVGEEWAGDPQTVAKSFQLQGQDKGGVTCKLLSVNQVGGRQVAQIKYSAACLRKIPLQNQAADCKLVLQGTSDVDMQSGLVLTYNLKGTVDVSGTTQQNGQMVQTDNNSDVTITLAATPSGAAPVAGGAANATAANPAPTPAASAADFAGNYTGDKINIELINSAGQITGTITMGQQKFPLTASLDGQTLKGTFESGGNKFEFTATLQGNMLKFNTGGNSYTLQKPAVAPINPLDHI